MAAAMEQAAVPAALERLYMAHHVRVLKAAYRITGSMADAEDVVQTVFLRIAQGADAHPLLHGTYATPNPESYLYRAGINAAIDLLRHRQSQGAAPLDEAMPAGAQAGPEREWQAQELRAWLRQAVARLGPRAAEMFVLRYLEDCDNREIARMLKTSSAVVALTLHRARGRLRKELRAAMKGEL